MNQEQERLCKKIYTYCASVVFLMMFVNLGTVLEWKRLKNVLKHPIGPFLGFVCRFFLMPSLSLGLGRIFLPNNKELQLGLLFTSMSPSGGLANIFTVFLKGNIGLSLTTTAVNSLLALALLPLWILVIVPATYDRYDLEIEVPFVDLATSAAKMIMAILIGILCHNCIPKTTRLIFRFLKPILIFLSFLLIALTISLYFYVFKELSWQISVAVILLPFIGYLCAFGLSKLFCRSSTDALTIAIETSVLTMTLPILLLRHTFADDKINSIVIIPIAASLASLCLASIFYILRRIFGWNEKVDEDGFDEKLLLTD